MADKSLRLRVACSATTLPVTAAATAALWLLPFPPGAARWGGLLATALAAYVMMECNNRNALLRIRSRMTTTSFLALTAACPFLHGWQPAMAAVVALLAALTLLFATYQQRHAEGRTFYAFFFMGLGSLLFPPLLLLVPLLCAAMLFYLRSLTGRTFLAALFGLALPYWGYVGWMGWHNRLDTAFAYMLPYLAPGPPRFSALPPQRMAALGAVLVLVVPAIFHFWRTSYNDKIRTRMLYHTLVLTVFGLLALLALRPQWHDALLRLLLAAGAPFVGHHFALARGRLMDVWFVVCLVLLGALAVSFRLLPWTP